jgi:uncharacterized membrane protein YagU involved in acid resistance
MTKTKHDLRAGFAGVLGGLAGLLAMGAVMHQTRKLLPKNVHRDLPKGEDPSWSIVGDHHEPNESATGALGRMGYERITGERPSPELEEQLSNVVHWTYGLAVGAVYGLIRGRRRRPRFRSRPTVDALSGAAYGAGLWLFGDMLAVPLFGLADKPARFVPGMHVHSLIGHLAFGLATAAGTRSASKLLARR